MPLLKGTSKKTVEKNTKELIESGRDAKQAYAISMKNANKSKTKKKPNKKSKGKSC